MTRLSAPATATDHVSGSLAAPIVIVEYGDFDCPHTRAANTILKRLMAEHSGKLALVFRHFPLRHMHQNADALALLLQATTASGRYWQAHDAVMAIRHMSVPAAQEALRAQDFDVEALAKLAPEVASQVQLDEARGRADGVHSTPSFFFNGAPWDGHYDIDTLRAQLEAAL